LAKVGLKRVRPTAKTGKSRINPLNMYINRARTLSFKAGQTPTQFPTLEPSNGFQVASYQL
jgi:hypothetical protein